MEEYEKYLKEGKYDIISRKMNTNEDFRYYIINRTKFLHDDVGNVVRIWHIKNDVYTIPKCRQCGENTQFTKSGGNRKGYNFYCTHSCQMSYINLNRSEEDKFIRKEKIKKTCLEKYGTEHYFSSDTIKNKKKKTYINRYGVENPSQLSWVKDKKKQTCLKSYGVENPSQSSSIQSKKTLTTRDKKIITECGKVYSLDGFEPFALNELLITHKPKDILHHTEIENEIGRIYYNYGGKTSVYHPDIFIKNENKIIEVKSLYWYKQALERNLIKKNTCEGLGYFFEFWVYDSNGLNKVIY